MEESSSQLELIMSNLDEEAEGVEKGVANHVRHSYTGSSQNILRNICFLGSAALFIFAFGMQLSSDIIPLMW